MGAGAGVEPPVARALDWALRAEGLARRFRSGTGELVVFENLCLRVAQGELVAIVGESGSGKSSLLHLLCGLDRPSAGDVYFGQRSLAAMGENELAEFRNGEIGFVWQQAYLLPEFTARENVMMPLLVRGEGTAVAGARAQAWLARVGLEDRATHRSGELSGGEQQRLALARALVGAPNLLLADEPTGNLDERTGAAVFDLLCRLQREQGLTTVMVTHNQAQAGRCDRVLRLHDGQLRPRSSE